MHGSTVFLIAFFTSILTTIGTAYVVERFDVFGAFQEQPELAEVPDLRGLTEADARENSKVQRFSLLIKGRVPSTEGKPGTVIGQSVAAGQKIPVGHPIAVTIAEEMPTAPAVIGLTVEEATTRLHALGFEVEVGEPVADATVAEGKIVTQQPAAGAALEKKGKVTVSPSSGPGEIEVPKVVGLSLNKAKTELEKAGLKVGPVRWVSIAETATFVVLNQKPEPAKKVKADTEIQLTANR
jgi:serine/threonine-protein kinase